MVSFCNFKLYFKTSQLPILKYFVVDIQRNWTYWYDLCFRQCIRQLKQQDSPRSKKFVSKWQITGGHKGRAYGSNYFPPPSFFNEVKPSFLVSCLLTDKNKTSCKHSQQLKENHISQQSEMTFLQFFFYLSSMCLLRFTVFTRRILGLYNDVYDNQLTPRIIYMRYFLSRSYYRINVKPSTIKHGRYRKTRFGRTLSDTDILVQ